MLIVLGFVTMFVWLSAVIVALFTWMANESWVLGAYGAGGLYCILALILGVSPVAPGSVADTVGGFLLVKIYMHDRQGLDFFAAFCVALVYVTFLHFFGSCLQYFIGKVKSLKSWANFSMPPDILAASDSVLLDANCFTVGIVGQVFMDTFSGMNQGRMGMDFCTQFWSEYASLPTGYSWVAFGALLSVQGLSGYEWATQVLPICFLMAMTWQFVGTTLGSYKILRANKKDVFWKNKEKWETVQYFFKEGVKATKDGWKVDCFCLHEKGFSEHGERLGMKECLFDKIKPKHKAYMEEILATNTTVKKHKVTQKKYNHDRSAARKEHWQKLMSMYFKKQDGILQTEKAYESFFVTFEPIPTKNDNSWRKGKYQWFLVLAAIILGIYSYMVIGRKVETEEAVQEGMKVLEDVGFLQWFAFAVYNLIVLVYYNRLLIKNIKSCYRAIVSFLFCAWCGVSDDPKVETTFKPTWVVPKDGELKTTSKPTWT